MEFSRAWENNRHNYYLHVYKPLLFCLFFVCFLLLLLLGFVVVVVLGDVVVVVVLGGFRPR